ncbi:MAG TPA: amylo-alpha-1,6-glucosidase [Verrucomicrobiae bacterium]|nr:amylo-alpha-1,6-glucosidase [Verrucomicrobiae bacterium]
MKRQKHGSTIYSLAWSPDGRILASGSGDYLVGIWDWDAQRATFRTALPGYWGHYEGAEDTRRKPAYHNGTAWKWTFPAFCEAMAKAWDFDPAATEAAKAYLSSMDRLLSEGCLGHIPEILDGDYPHQQRNCDAQAWGATEALCVWKLLKKHSQ